MKFIRLAFLLFLPFSLTAFAQVPSSFFGLHILHAVNGSTPWPSDQFGALRLWDSGVDWHEIETSRGAYDWSAFDRWMSLAQQHNVDVTYTFGRVPSWANGGGGTSVPMSNMQDWDDFVRAVVTRAAGRVKYWEIWNEPNDSHFWTGDVGTLVTMAQHAHDIIKSVDPNAVILTPSPTWTSTSPEQWMAQYLQAGGGKYADIIAFHGYVNASPESIDSLAANMRKVMNANAQSGKPLWDTEASWSLADSCSASICDPDQQAAFLVRHYMLHLSRGVDRYYWYAWEDTWGTLWTKSGGVQKPGVAYQQVQNWLIGATLSQACVADSSSTWTCGITRPNGYEGLVVWNPGKTVQYTAPAQYKSYRDIYGGSGTVPTNGVVSVNFKPILLETNAASGGAPAPTPSPAPAISDFVITASSPSVLTVATGQSASVGLNITPGANGFNSAIKLSCSGLPAGSSCRVSPSSVTPGTKPVSVALQITAGAASASMATHRGWSLAMLMPLVGITFAGARRKQMAAGLVVVAIALMLAGCGAASHTSTTTSSQSVNAAYNVTVTATSGSVQHSVVVPVAVK